MCSSSQLKHYLQKRCQWNLLKMNDMDFGCANQSIRFLCDLGTNLVMTVLTNIFPPRRIMLEGSARPISLKFAPNSGKNRDKRKWKQQFLFIIVSLIQCLFHDPCSYSLFPDQSGSGCIILFQMLISLCNHNTAAVLSHFSSWLCQAASLNLMVTTSFIPLTWLLLLGGSTHKNALSVHVLIVRAIARVCSWWQCVGFCASTSIFQALYIKKKVFYWVEKYGVLQGSGDL